MVDNRGEDADNDGCPIEWEHHYGHGYDDWYGQYYWYYDPFTYNDHAAMDLDNDGLDNVEEYLTWEYGSDPFRKDIFIEIDWMPSSDTEQSNKPTPESILQAVDEFQHHNISLHIDIGGLGGGEQIPYIRKCTFSQVVDMYWYYFLHTNMSNPRKGIFRYGIICDEGPDVNFPDFRLEQP